LIAFSKYSASIFMRCPRSPFAIACVTWHCLRVFKENAFGGEVIRDGPLTALISLLGTLLLVPLCL
jgi:hypothetical protein